MNECIVKIEAYLSERPHTGLKQGDDLLYLPFSAVIRTSCLRKTKLLLANSTKKLLVFAKNVDPSYGLMTEASLAQECITRHVFIFK